MHMVAIYHWITVCQFENNTKFILFIFWVFLFFAWPGPSDTETRFLIDQLYILHEVVVQKCLEVKPEHSEFLLGIAK